MLGRQIKNLRQQQAISRETLANRTGISEDVLEEIEEGFVQPPIDNKLVLRIADQLQFKSGLDFAEFMRLNRARKFKAYVVGLAKTGTVSLKGIFGDYWTGHEFNQWNTHQMIIKYQTGMLAKEMFHNFILDRDRLSGFLELDSAHFNRHYMDILSEAYPNAKFVCLIRDCYSWLKSYINYFTQPDREALQSSFKRNGLPFDLPRGACDAKQELIRNFHKYIDGALSFWANEYNAILEKCDHLSKDRYLIIRTNEIMDKIDELARLTGVSSDTLLRENAHLNKAEYRVNILKRLDFDFLKDKFDRHCSVLMRKFFPDFTLRDFIN